jgi:hypothetical protein
MIAGVMPLLLPAGAWADAIDGHWCHIDGRRFEIDGATVVTPARTRTQGAYNRHYFSYVVPTGEALAGGTVDMALINEMTVLLKLDRMAEETWQRCGPPISQIESPPLRTIGMGNA